MAKITNGAKPRDRRKDLWSHVSFSDLYSYNPAIAELTALSKKVITQYLAQGTGDKMPGVTKLKDGAFICGGERAIPQVVVPIENFRNEPTDDTPKQIIFSTMEIIDPYNIVPTPASIAAAKERLLAYITLGLYPLVSEPMSEGDAASAFEKYDNLTEDRHMIGTIVDVRDAEDMESGNKHLVATVMWEPDFSSTTTLELINSFAGTLMLRDIIKTPAPWVSQDAEPVYTNNGVPVYEYNHVHTLLSQVTYCYQFNSYFNEAMVTGNFKLDFVDHLLQNLHETAQMAKDIRSDAIAALNAKETVAPPPPPTVEMPRPADGATLEDGATYEDATPDSELRRKLRLYETPFDPKAWDEDDDTVIL